MDDTHDVVVVGAGPAGSAAAFEAARLGCGRVLLIDKADMGRPKPCGGGLSPRARDTLSRMGLWDEIQSEAYPIRGLRLVTPRGRDVVLAGDETASVLNRSRLDSMLAEAAKREGACLLFDSRVERLILEDGRAAGVLLESGEEIRARWTIVAGGATSRLVRHDRPRRLIHTCMAWFDNVPFTPHILEMVYDPALSPHYGWLFPESQQRANIGVCLFAERLQGRSIRRVFQEFLDRHYGERLAGASQVGPWRGHPISTTVEVNHEAPQGVLIAGEAGRLTNIATGEGISYALDSGLFAARAIRRGDEEGWPMSRTSSFYEKSLRSAFNRRFRAADIFTRRGMGLLDAAARLGNWGPVRSATARSLARL